MFGSVLYGIMMLVSMFFAGFGSSSYWYDAIRVPSDCNSC